MLYKFIFYKAYYFCIRFLKEKEFPWAWAGITTAIIIVVTIIALLELMEFLSLPKRINIYGEYHGYFSLGIAIITLFYVKHDNRYLRILETCKSMPLKKQKMLSYLSLAYLVVLFIGFFWLGEIIRDFNLNHRR